VGQGRERRLDEAALRIPGLHSSGLASHDSMSSVTTRRLAAILDVDGAEPIAAPRHLFDATRRDAALRPLGDWQT